MGTISWRGRAGKRVRKEREPASDVDGGDEGAEDEDDDGPSRARLGEGVRREQGDSGLAAVAEKNARDRIAA